MGLKKWPQKVANATLCIPRWKIGWMENQVPKEVFVRIGPHHVPSPNQVIYNRSRILGGLRAAKLGRNEGQNGPENVCSRSMSCKIGL